MASIPLRCLASSCLIFMLPVACSPVVSYALGTSSGFPPATSTTEPSSASRLGTPKVSASAMEMETLQPVYVVIAVPLKTADENEEAAIELLRQRRILLTQKAVDMGADPKDVHSLFFSGKFSGESLSATPRLLIRRQGTPVDAVPKFEAKCLVIVIFDSLSTQDHEASLAEAQARLSELTSVIPEPNVDDNTTRASNFGLRNSAAGLVFPEFVFAAKVTPEQHKRMLKKAVAGAIREATILAEAIDSQIVGRLQISNTGNPLATLRACFITGLRGPPQAGLSLCFLSAPRRAGVSSADSCDVD